MPELRWILIVLGLLLLAGLWWWETRRRLRAPERDEPVPLDQDAEATPAAPVGKESPEAAATASGGDVPPIRASRRERGPVGRELPVVEIPEDAEPELARDPPEDEFVPPSVPYRAMGEALDDIPEDLRNLPHDERAEAEQRQPWVRTQPLDRDKVRAANGQASLAGGANEPRDALEDMETSAGTEDDDAHSEAARQRIVALRLVCDRGRWPGREVIDALGAEGLVFGKYSIFHRQRDDGKTIFFVASMVEPGSFDVERADEQSYPGISIFTVVPAPVDAPTTFDLMLASGRRLADRLGGHLQDEQGSTLTAQRILSLREELVHFEHVSKRLQKR
jgi:cell division protein ZipA